MAVAFRKGRRTERFYLALGRLRLLTQGGDEFVAPVSLSRRCWDQDISENVEHGRGVLEDNLSASNSLRQRAWDKG